MESSLEHLVSEGVVSEVIGRLKSGKEADVYVVRYGGQVVAAKVYKDRAHRSFKNNADYKEGRSVRNSRSQRAIDRGSKFGKEAAEDAWKAAEAATLYKLHAAGVRVPTPVLFLEGVLFMELVLGADGEPAARLIDVDLDASLANAAYMDMLSQLVRILSCDLIHGDLSPYNVLWSARGPTIIDFPQIVSASHNSNSERFFLRDAENVLGHFVGIDPRLRARGGDAREIWRAYVRRELTPDFMPSGRPLPAEQRPRPAPNQHDGRPRNPPNQHDGRLRGPHPQQDSRPRGPRPGNDGRPRAPQAQHDARSRGSQQDSRPRGSQPQDGRGAQQRGPRPGNDARGGDQRGNRGGRPEPSRPSGGGGAHGAGAGARRPAPEVIVMTRRSTPAGPVVDRPGPRPPAPPEDGPRRDAPPRHRPRRRN